MTTRMENVFIVCTSAKMIDSYDKVLQDLDLDIDIEFIGNRFADDMEAFLNYVDGSRARGKEILVTRGFVAQQVRRYLDFKVIEIAISAYDVLRVLYKYAERDITVGVVECRAFIEAVLPVAEFLKIKVKGYEVNCMEEFYRNSQQAVEDGVDVICGGSIKYYNEFFNHLHVEYEPIDSSEHSIRASLINAMSMYQLVNEEKKKTEFVETLMNVSDAGLMAVDSLGKIISMNHMAQTIWNVDRREATGKELETLNPDIDPEEIHSILHQTSGVFNILGQNILIDKIPMAFENDYLGFVLKMRKAEEILREDSRVRNILAEKGLQARYTISDIKGKSEAIRRLVEWTRRYAKTDSTVLITGESGTGKEVFAQAIHNASDRRDHPFVAINCSSFQSSLLDSELFGYVDGAFTGARKNGKIGLFKLAHTGTIFLDEIGDMDMQMQVKILRAIQEREIMRIGDDKIISVDVRIIAATNKNLFEEVLKGNFREELYFRLNILNIHIPPLRQRKEDIDTLANLALAEVSKRLKCSITGIEQTVVDRMKEYDWHGNVRELNNFVEKMVILAGSGKIIMEDVEGLFVELDEKVKIYQEFHGKGTPDSPDSLRGLTLAQAETVLIESTLRENGFNKTVTAEKLGIDRATLNRKLSRKGKLDI